MHVEKKRLFQKTDKVSVDRKKNFSRFTLPSAEAQPPTQEIKSGQGSESESFWGSRRGLVWIAGFAVCIIGATIIAFFLYQEGSKKEVMTATPTPAPIEHVQKATPTPKEIDITKYKIQVLNGSGIKGEAAKVKGLLEEQKFTVSSTGNADSLNNQKTIIQAKKTVEKEYLDKLKGFLDKSYVLDDTKELDESEKTDVVIIVGSEKVSE